MGWAGTWRDVPYGPGGRYEDEMIAALYGATRVAGPGWLGEGGPVEAVARVVFMGDHENAL